MDEFAVTLTTLNEDRAREWEPGADLPAGRIEALRQFHEAEVDTWVSLEPVVFMEETRAIVEATREYTGHYRLGRLNRYGQANQWDWRGFTETMLRYFLDEQIPYFVKAELRPYVPEGVPDVWRCERP